jgi:metal-responsive CopG/Arc/MetJ family transcriptional regulator
MSVDKALVALPDQVWDIIDRDLKGKLGTGRSDTVRAIVLAYLSEKGYMDKGGRNGEKESQGR